MILDEDVQNAFRQLYHAHRETAIAEDRVARLKAELEQAELEVTQCQGIVREMNDKINRLARAAGGIPARVADAAPSRGEYVPIRR